MALYAQPALWVGLAVFAIVRLENVIWLSLVGECGLPFSTVLFVQGAQLVGYTWQYNYNGTGQGVLRVLDNLLTNFLADLAIALVLTITNTVAFSRCDKFSQASNLASSAMYSGGLARSLAGGMFSRLFNR